MNAFEILQAIVLSSAAVIITIVFFRWLFTISSISNCRSKKHELSKDVQFLNKISMLIDNSIMELHTIANLPTKLKHIYLHIMETECDILDVSYHLELTEYGKKYSKLFDNVGIYTTYNRVDLYHNFVHDSLEIIKFRIIPEYDEKIAQLQLEKEVWEKLLKVLQKIWEIIKGLLL